MPAKLLQQTNDLRQYPVYPLGLTPSSLAYYDKALFVKLHGT